MKEFSREEILAGLLASYQGLGDAGEGSFAGDVLRACADALAQLHSTEIDGLARRAFVSGAAGDFLTAVCADRGVTRREGESDEALRRRTLEKLAATPASGNEGHYRDWCGQAAGILRSRVFPCARGGGTVDIVAAGLQGGAPTAGAIAAAQSIVNENRPVGADARVFPAQEVAVNVSGVVTLAEGGSVSAINAAYTAALAEYYKEQALRSTTVSFARVLGLLLDCPGVEDVTDFRLGGGTGSLTLGERETATAGTVTLEEATG